MKEHPQLMYWLHEYWFNCCCIQPETVHTFTYYSKLVLSYCTSILLDCTSSIEEFQLTNNMHINKVHSQNEFHILSGLNINIEARSMYFSVLTEMYFIPWCLYWADFRHKVHTFIFDVHIFQHAGLYYNNHAQQDSSRKWWYIGGLHTQVLHCKFTIIHLMIIVCLLLSAECKWLYLLAQEYCPWPSSHKRTGRNPHRDQQIDSL